MRHVPAEVVLDYLRLHTVGGSAATDRDLLRRYVGERDEAAFTELVKRHGSMVLSVCRRTLGDPHAAEDACQGVFLALAERAGRSGWHDSIASWLYTTAFHHARRARDAAARRSRREANVRASAVKSVESELTARELLQGLDEELNRLPETYRAPLVLCYLQGATRDEAARRLGLPLGTLKSRVERGRELLRDGLERRGLSLSVLLVAQTVAPAPLTPGLAKSIVGAALLVSASGFSGLGKAALALLLATGIFVAVNTTRPSAGPPTVPAGAERAAREDDGLPPDVVARLGPGGMQACVLASLVMPLPDGKTFLSVSHRKGHGAVITIWDLSTGKLLRRYPLPALDGPDISTDGKTLIGVSYRGRERSVLCYELGSGKPIAPQLAKGTAALAAAIGPDGDTVALAGSDGRLRLWSLAKGKALREWEIGKESWHRLAFSPDGRTIVATSDQKSLGVWDVTTGREIRRSVITLQSLLPTWSVRSLVFSPGGKEFALATDRATEFQIHELASGAVRKLAIESVVSAVAFSADGSKLVTGDWELNSRSKPSAIRPKPLALRIWDVKTGREVQQFASQTRAATAVAFSRDGTKVITGGDDGLRVHDATTGKPLLPTTTLPQSGVTTAVFSPDGKSVATGGSIFMGSLRLWDAETGTLLRSFGDGHSPLAFSPDGRCLISSGLHGLKFWEAATGKELGQIPTERAPFERFAYAPDGRTFLTHARKSVGNDRFLPGPVRFWDATTHREIPGPTLSTAGVLDAISPFSKDGKRLVTVETEPRAAQGVLKIWDIPSRKEIRRWTVPPITRFCLSPDGGTLVGSDLPFGSGSVRGPLYVVDLDTGKARSFELPKDTLIYDGGFAMCYSPDGRCIAYGTSDGTAVLWEVASGQLRRRLLGLDSAALCIAISPDGKRLASGGYDVFGLVWDLTGRAGGKRRGAPPSRRELLQLWEALAGDADKADQAMTRLTASPEQALPFLQGALKPAVIDERRLRQLIEQLDDDRFLAREEAVRELEKMRDLARPALLEALKGKLSPEARRRAERLVHESALGMPAGRLRELRAVEVLERLGAKEMLATLAKGTASARLTREAAGALDRLAKR